MTVYTLAFASLVGAVLTLYLGYWALTEFRRRHPDGWRESVGVRIARPGARPSREYLRLWWTGDYRRFGDTKVDVIALASMVSFSVTLGLLAFTGVSAVWLSLVTL